MLEIRWAIRLDFGARAWGLHQGRKSMMSILTSLINAALSGLRRLQKAIPAGRIFRTRILSTPGDLYLLQRDHQEIQIFLGSKFSTN